MFVGHLNEATCSSFQISPGFSFESSGTHEGVENNQFEVFFKKDSVSFSVISLPSAPASVSDLSCPFRPLQVKYREGGKKEQSTNLYSALPETEEMKLAKAAMELQSEVGGRL